MEYEKIILDLIMRVDALEEEVAKLKNSAIDKNSKQPGTQQITEYIYSLFNQEKEKGNSYIVIKANDIHKQLKLTSRMPAVCNVMKRCMRLGDEVLHETPSGFSSTFEVKYYLDKWYGKLPFKNSTTILYL